VWVALSLTPAPFARTIDATLVRSRVGESERKKKREKEEKKRFVKLTSGVPQQAIR